jgi:DNA-binding response OmpR family regulator
MNNTSIKVLIIEDSAAQQRFLRKSIELSTAHHFDVRCASDLETGIEEAGRSPCDVVLLDLNLPDSTGKDTLLRFQGVIKGG